MGKLLTHIDSGVLIVRSFINSAQIVNAKLNNASASWNKVFLFIGLLEMLGARMLLMQAEARA